MMLLGERPGATMRNLRIVLILTSTGFLAAGTGHAEPSVCQRLANLAEQVPAVDWTASSKDPMDKLMHASPPSESRGNLSPVEELLINDPTWRSEFAVGPQAVLGIEQLQGTDVYRIDSVQGTAECQSMIFVEASAGSPTRRLPAPFEEAPCVTQDGRFGNVFGQPIFIVGGDVDMTGLARSYTVSAWRVHEESWSPACKLGLEFDQRLKVSGTYCSHDAVVCEAASREAPAVVEAYDGSLSINPLTFARGHQPPAALAKQLSGPSSIPLTFPTFGVTTKEASNPFLTTFTNARDPARLALWIDQRWWLGVVGVAGIGWRESTTSLLVIYAMTQTGLVPAASFQVEKFPAGSARAHWQ